MQLIKNYKTIFDNIHGYIYISNIACQIIDTCEFQRLKYLHQLGVCHYVYPNATHTRFEHSIGTYYLTEKILMAIRKNSDCNEINNILKDVDDLKDYYKITGKIELDDHICEIIKIAALCHDLGHGPFSHTFDDIFLKLHDKSDNPNKMHEVRSLLILKQIMNSNKHLQKFIGSELNLINNLINPQKNHTSFVYQIVSNLINSIDVDKYDYLARDTFTLGQKYGFNSQRLVDDVKVINNKICFPVQMYYEVASLFSTRYRLHKQIYNHKTVIAIQHMIKEIMISIDPIIKITDSINNMNKFCDLTDDYILSIVKFLHNDENNKKDDYVNKAYNILNDLNVRNLYKFIGTIVVPQKEEITDELQKILGDINLDDIIIHVAHIGFISGNKKIHLMNCISIKEISHSKLVKIKLVC